MKYLNTFFIIHLYEYFTKLQIGNRRVPIFINQLFKAFNSIPNVGNCNM